MLSRYVSSRELQTPVLVFAASAVSAQRQQGLEELEPGPDAHQVDPRGSWAVSVS